MYNVDRESTCLSSTEICQSRLRIKVIQGVQEKAGELGLVDFVMILLRGHVARIARGAIGDCRRRGGIVEGVGQTISTSDLRCWKVIK